MIVRKVLVKVMCKTMNIPEHSTIITYYYIVTGLVITSSHCQLVVSRDVPIVQFFLHITHCKQLLNIYTHPTACMMYPITSPSVTYYQVTNYQQHLVF